MTAVDYSGTVQTALSGIASEIQRRKNKGLAKEAYMGNQDALAELTADDPNTAKLVSGQIAQQQKAAQLLQQQQQQQQLNQLISASMGGNPQAFKQLSQSNAKIALQVQQQLDNQRKMRTQILTEGVKRFPNDAEAAAWISKTTADEGLTPTNRNAQQITPEMVANYRAQQEKSSASSHNKLATGGNMFFRDKEGTLFRPVVTVDDSTGKATRQMVALTGEDGQKPVGKLTTVNADALTPQEKLDYNKQMAENVATGTGTGKANTISLEEKNKQTAKENTEDAQKLADWGVLSQQLALLEDLSKQGMYYGNLKDKVAKNLSYLYASNPAKLARTKKARKLIASLQMYVKPKGMNRLTQLEWQNMMKGAVPDLDSATPEEFQAGIDIMRSYIATEVTSAGAKRKLKELLKNPEENALEIAQVRDLLREQNKINVLIKEKTLLNEPITIDEIKKALPPENKQGSPKTPKNKPPTYITPEYQDYIDKNPDDPNVIAYKKRYTSS